MCALKNRRGPSGKSFNFTFHQRGTDEQLDELGRLMTNVCKLVPGGVVCFLASYGYLDQARATKTRTIGTLEADVLEPHLNIETTTLSVLRGVEISPLLAYGRGTTGSC